MKVSDEGISGQRKIILILLSFLNLNALETIILNKTTNVYRFMTLWRCKMKLIWNLEESLIESLNFHGQTED